MTSTFHVPPLSGLRNDKRQHVSIEPKGMDFARIIIARAVHPGNQAEQVKYAEARWGEGSRPALVTKADVVGGNTAAGYGAQLISSEGVAAEFFAQAYAESLIGKVGAHRIPARTPFVKCTSPTTAHWVGEGDGKPTSSMSFTRQSPLDPTKIIVLSVFTMELPGTWCRVHHSQRALEGICGWLGQCVLKSRKYRRGGGR